MRAVRAAERPPRWLQACARSPRARTAAARCASPASCCGVLGFKASRGRVSNAPFAPGIGLGTTGPLARTTSDAAAYLDVVGGYEWGDPFPPPPPERPFADEIGVDPGRLRVALTTASPNDGEVDEACVAAAREAADLLASLGHDVEEAAPEWGGAELMEDFKPIWQVGPSLFPVRDPSVLSPLNQAFLRGAAETPSAVYAAAVSRLQMRARKIASFWSSYDLLLTPTLAHAARARRLGGRAGGAVGAVRPRRAVHPVHRRLQRDRAARGLVAAVTGRTPGCRSASSSSVRRSATRSSSESPRSSKRRARGRTAVPRIRRRDAGRAAPAAPLGVFARSGSAPADPDPAQKKDVRDGDTAPRTPLCGGELQTAALTQVKVGRR